MNQSGRRTVQDVIPRRRGIELAGKGAVALLFLTLNAVAQLPTTGTTFASLAAADQLVTNFMVKWNVPGGAVGFVRDGKLLFFRGYGYADRDTREAVQPDSLFRLASLSKAFTATAILRLVEAGQLNLDQPAFSILNYPPPTYAAATYDPRLASITIRHLLNHTGGWDRHTALNPDGGVGFDPTVNWATRAATDMGTSAPADAATVVRWMLGKPLQFDPGTQYQYSNFGYTVLGRIIETLTGTNYETFIGLVAAEAGISRLKVSGSRFAEKRPAEVTSYDYSGAPLTPSIFPQDAGPVPWPYNFSCSTMDSHGGLAASVLDVLRFVCGVDGRSTYEDILSSTSISNMTARPCPPWGPTQEPYYGMGWMVRNTPGNWWHDGSLPGVRTEMVRAGNGFTWVLLFNTRVVNDNGMYSEMDALGWKVLNSVSTWPTQDLFDAVLSYPAWQARRFTRVELVDPAISADNADPDGDGLQNLMEYALGLEPKTPDLNLRPAGGIQSIDQQVYGALTFRRRLLAHEVAYAVETSSNLGLDGSGTAIELSVQSADGFQTVTVRDGVPLPNHACRFMRLKVMRLLNDLLQKAPLRLNQIGLFSRVERVVSIARALG